MLRLRNKVEARLNDEVIIIACDLTEDKENIEKVIFFNYDAKKVAIVKTLSNRSYDADQKCWRTKSPLKSIKETLKDYKLEIVYFFRKEKIASEFMHDDFYKENQDINIVLTTAIKEEEKDGFIEDFLKPHGLTMIKDVEYTFEEFNVEQAYTYLKLA